jgi:hypothetical protein
MMRLREGEWFDESTVMRVYNYGTDAGRPVTAVVQAHPSGFTEFFIVGMSAEEVGSRINRAVNEWKRSWSGPRNVPE